MPVRVGVGRMLTLAPLLLSLWGCALAYPEPFSRFQPEGKVAAGPMVDRIAVEPVNEAHPAGGRTSIGKGALAFIPLWPYGPQQWRTIGHRHDLRAGLQSAVVNDLIASGLARDVFSGSMEMAARMPGDSTPYALNITLHEAVWNRNVTCYGVSLAAPFLWLLSAPISYGSGVVDFSAEVRDRSGRSLGSRRFAARRGITEWPYSSQPTAKAFSDSYAGSRRRCVSSSRKRWPAAHRRGELHAGGDCMISIAERG